MVTFNDLRLSDNRRYMLINAEIDEEFASTHYISDVWVEYYKYRNADGAPNTDKAYLAYEYHEGAEKLTAVDLTVDSENFTLEANGVSTFVGGLFYVIVVCRALEDDTDMTADLGAVLDWQKVYEIGMRSVTEITASCKKNCELPEFFEQFVIVYHALELALDAQDLDQIDKLWSRFISFSAPNGALGSPCNCR